jgi:hypothetical protein
MADGWQVHESHNARMRISNQQAATGSRGVLLAGPPDNGGGGLQADNGGGGAFHSTFALSICAAHLRYMGPTGATTRQTASDSTRCAAAPR